MSKGPKQLKSAEEFFFETPLYSTFIFESITETRRTFGFGGKVDGFCWSCRREVTFTARRQQPAEATKADGSSSLEASLVCDRDSSHKLVVYVSNARGTFQKIGQFPSLATVTQAELAKFRALMSERDGKEFYAAIGLAAHGVGIGSFVYLRRVFERMFSARFRDHQAENGWIEEDFLALRMAERVSYLKDHVPQFLVENARIYSILSRVHSLDEEACLQHFEVLKQSIMLILEQDDERKKQREHEARLRSALQEIDLTGGGEASDEA